MKFFDYKNYTLSLNDPELLLVKEFETVWRSDDNVTKEKAFRIFQYIYLVVDFSSPYSHFSEEERMEKAKQDSKLTTRQIESPLVQNCLEAYREILESNRILRLIHSMYKSIDELEVYFSTINFTERVMEGARKGTMLHSPTELIRVMEKASGIIEAIKSLEVQVKEELKEDSGIRGGAEESFIMEDND